MLAEKYEQAVRNSELQEAEKNGEARGKEQFATLTLKLLKDQRTSDIEKAATDKEYCERLYVEYGIKKS